MQKSQSGKFVLGKPNLGLKDELLKHGYLVIYNQRQIPQVFAFPILKYYKARLTTISLLD